MQDAQRRYVLLIFSLYSSKKRGGDECRLNAAEMGEGKEKFDIPDGEDEYSKTKAAESSLIPVD